MSLSKFENIDKPEIFHSFFEIDDETVAISQTVKRTHREAWLLATHPLIANPAIEVEFHALRTPIRIVFGIFSVDKHLTRMFNLPDNASSGTPRTSSEPTPGVIALQVPPFRIHDNSLVGGDGNFFDDPGDSGNPVGAVPCQINLYSPSNPDDPVKIWKFPNGKLGNTNLKFDPRADNFPIGKWRVRLILTQVGIPATVTLQASAVIREMPRLKKSIPKRLIERMVGSVIEAIAPRFRMDGDVGTISISKDLAAMAGIEQHSKIISIPVAQSNVKLRNFAVEFGSGKDVKEEINSDIQKSETELEKLPHGSQNNAQRAVLNKRISKLEDARDRFTPDWPTLVFRLAFLDANIKVAGLELASIQDGLGKLFLSFKPDLRDLKIHVDTGVELSSLGSVLNLIVRIFSDSNFSPESIDKIIKDFIKDSDLDIDEAMREYLRLVLERLVAQNSKILNVHAIENGWEIEYFEFIKTPVFRRPGDLLTNVVTATGANTAIDDSGTGTGTGNPNNPIGGLTGVASFELPIVGNAVPINAPIAAELNAPIGAGTGSMIPPALPVEIPNIPLDANNPPWPPEFQVVGGDAVNRLDKIGTIMVVMMENRSFDHLLGDLARSRPRPGGPENNYICAPNRASNRAAGGFVNRIETLPASHIGLNRSIQVSPHHGFDHVAFQMGGGDVETMGNGAMDGFALDISSRTDAPQIAMSYYKETELPVYYRLADEFKICDQWFCAHPGPTFPNRWATITGTIPEIENLSIDDERLGYLKEKTIFDLLSEKGIEWKYFESDVSIIRMYDKYRLDDTNVLPIDHEDDGLKKLLQRGGALPRVIFAEPDFADFPPVSTASDDHPPADLGQGQAFIARIYNLIRNSPHWGRISLLITYDEHGGFYDHVAPPGTTRGDPDWLGNIPKLHPDGAEYFGPRVPAFLVSPYVSAGSVSHQVFDHTALIKTILVHNRDKLESEDFIQFGPRVNSAAHLGQAFDLDTPRPPPTAFSNSEVSPLDDQLTALPGTITEVATSLRASTTLANAAMLSSGQLMASTRVSGQGPDDVDATVVAIPIISFEQTGWDEVPDEPFDFHAALRRAMAPRL